MKSKVLSVIFLLACAVMTAQETINISGNWEFQIDREDVGIGEKWWEKKLKDKIKLPGSMPERMKGDDISVNTQWVGSLYDSSYFYNPYMEKYRKPGKMKLQFFLTPDKHYVGVAWYRRTVTLKDYDNKARYTIYLERPHIETTLYVNGYCVGKQNSLSVAHEYDVTEHLKAGKNVIAVRVDNRHETVNVGQDSHSVTDQTQGAWNGIVGKMELRHEVRTRIADLQVYPDIDKKVAVVKMLIEGKPGETATISISAKAFNTDVAHETSAVEKTFTIGEGSTEAEMTLPMGNGVLLWDEFSPALYRLQANISAGDEANSRETTFGMRKFEIRGRMFYVNGREVQLRGTVENCCFPNTGYAPMDVESWMKVFNRCREYGLNHMRFHSYCPPEAAFEAADLTGFYIQPEGPSWPNHGVKLGYGHDIDTYLMDETKRISKVYGNHPSFCMLACGNEPAGRWVEWVSKFVDYWKKTDSRRVYTGASVGGSWAWQPKSEFHVKAGARGLGEWNNRAPETTYDYSVRIDTVSQPYVSHETGQWCVFPNFDEIKKYKGVNKAKNFEIFRDLLRDNDMKPMAKKFLMASGKLQLLCYKSEIERTLRTPNYAGFQLLSLNDYSGQGSALVGLTDVFFDDKGYCTAEDFREFCAPIVPLARFPKFTYLNNEQLAIATEVAQFSSEVIKNAEPVCTLTDALTGEVIAKRTLRSGDIQIGSNIGLGSCAFPLNSIKKATRLTLRITIPGTARLNGGRDASNSWDVWVYPAEMISREGDVYVCDSIDQKAKDILAKGGKVLLCAAGKVKYGQDVKQYFTPAFWNTSWFKMRPPHTTGLHIDSQHPVFDDFPTSYHSDMQWWELANKTQVMQLSDFPKGFQPIVQSIDTWFISRKIGMLFEANVMGGKLMMTTMDISSNLDKRIAARQMRHSILRYMNSDKFSPRHTLDVQLIEDLFTKEAPKVDMFTKQSPDELIPKKNR